MRQTYRTETIAKRGTTPHKLFSTAAAACLLFCTTTSVLAQTEFAGNLNTVSISDAAGTNSPPTAKFTYTQGTDTFSFDASGSSDSDGTITEYKWDFGDGSFATGATTTHQYQDLNKKDVTLTVVDNGNAISISQQSLQFQEMFNKAISFQPSTATVPNGYSVDNGKSFTVERNYGWTPYVGPGIVERNNPLSPGKEYDTLAFVYPTAKWEIAVNQGTYEVTVCVGDVRSPGAYDYNVQVEGTSFIDHEKTTLDNRWIEKTNVVAVADGKITLTFLNGRSNHDIAWLRINQLN